MAISNVRVLSRIYRYGVEVRTATSFPGGSGGLSPEMFWNEYEMQSGAYWDTIVSLDGEYFSCALTS